MNRKSIKILFFLVLTVCGISILRHLSISQTNLKEIVTDGQITIENWVRDTVNFKVDSTLKRQYQDVNMNITIKISDENIENTNQLYGFVEPYLNSLWGNDDVAIQKPFRINMIDSIWIIEGSLPRLKDGSDVIGGVFYLEVEKNGTIIKSIHSE